MAIGTYNYKGYSLRNRIFVGFLAVCLLTITSTSIVSYLILRNNAVEQSATDQQNKADALMASLDYAVSHTQVKTEDLPELLSNKIYEISDANKHDVILYSLQGKYLISNKDSNLVQQKSLPVSLINQVLRNEKISVTEYDESVDADVQSSYIILKNNLLEPIAIVYFPYYHNASAYMDVVNKYLVYMAIVNLIIIAFSIWLSWIISKHLTNALTSFSEKVNRITLFDKVAEPIHYYKNDELNSLVKAYNRMILQIQEQKERLSVVEREQAWREMAKQVAHEVKNPLTPMKLTIQNFERKFNPEDPNIREKVKKLTNTMVDQIDLIATVASAFSQFAQLPERHNETFNLNNEISNILQVFSDDRIFVHTNAENIMINMDKIYLNRIITNLVTNAKQASSDEREQIINVDIEKINRRISISVEDNGVGIPREMFGKIFEPNFTSKSSGMGLGLTMVKKMIEEYGGEIAVRSEIGKGTKFIIMLPDNL